MVGGQMIPLFKVHSPKNIGQKIEEVFESGLITEGRYSDEFESRFSSFIGNHNTCLVNSCTSALTLAYHTAGLKPGDEVLTTPMTCMATNEPIHHTGAKLVFADIDPSTGNIDPESVQSKITSKTKMIVGVHWAGQPFDIDSISSIAKENGLVVVEDAAHALGATYRNKRIGTHSDFVCFSFQAIKHMTTADGGAIACHSSNDSERIRKLRWFGLDRKFTGASKWEQDIAECGYKMHMNNINAVIGLEQMKYIDNIVEKHISNGQFYDKYIINPRLKKIVQQPKGQSSYWIYSVLVDDRDSFKEHLTENGVATDAVHKRNDTYSVFSHLPTEPLPGVAEFESRLMNIPVGWWVTDEQRQHIVNVVNAY
jgi:perosamine synthetase